MANKPGFVTEFCWRFRHPRFGWCGCEENDRWSDRLTVIETNASHCSWPVEIYQRVRQIGKKFILPGSFRLVSKAES